MRRLRDRRRHRGDDRAGVLVGVELERDRGADHVGLPLERDREPAYPFFPPQRRAVDRIPRIVERRARQRLVGAEHEGRGVLDEERPLVGDGGERSVGGHAQRELRRDVADVMAARRRFRTPRVPLGRRAQAHGDARRSRKPPHVADQRVRGVHAVELAMARHAVDDLDGAAVAVVERRGQHGRVADEVLLAAHLVGELDREQAPGRLGRRGVEKRAERRVAVEAREAAPHDRAVGIDQEADPAVADQREVEVALRRAHDVAGPGTSAAIHARTASTSGSR
jgi:hypothetical protein